MLRNQFIQVTVAALVVVGVLGACRNLIVDSTAEINEAFWLKYRQTKSLPEEGLQIRFQELLEDSRCPEDVVCVWEGVARIELEL